MFDPLNLAASGIAGLVVQEIYAPLKRSLKEKFSHRELKNKILEVAHKALRDFSKQYPELVSSFFDEHFIIKAEPIFIGVFTSRAATPAPEDLVDLYLKQFSQDISVPSGEIISACSSFIQCLEQAIKEEPCFREIADSRELNQTYRASVDTNEIVHRLEDMFSQHIAISDNASSSVDYESKINEDIDKYRKLIKTNPQVALSLFTELFDSNENASNDIRFRVLANIGAAYFELNNIEKASEYLFDAGACVSNEAKGISKIAFGNLIKSEYDLAESLSRQAIVKDSGYVEAYSILIAALSQRISPQEVENEIPDEVKNDFEVMFALGSMYFVSGVSDKALFWTEKAYLLRKDNREIKALYAQSLLSHTLNELKGNLKYIQDDVKVTIDKVQKILSSVWDEVKNSPQAQNYCSSATNLALALYHLNENDKAKNILDEVIDRDPTASKARQVAAMLSYKQSKVEQAYEYLKHADIDDDSQTTFMLAETLTRMGRYEEAKLKLEAINLTEEDRDDKLSIIILNSFIAYQQNEISIALSILDDGIDSVDYKIPLVLEKSFILRETDQISEAKNIVRQASALINEITSSDDIIRVADELYDLNLYNEAALNYKKVVDLKSDNILLQKYAYSLLYAENREELSKIINIIPEEIQSKKNFKKLIGKFYLQAGDFDKSIAAFESYLEEDDDLEIRLNWLQIHQDLLNDDVIREYFSTKPDYKKYSHHLLMTFYHLMAKYGYSDQALMYAYELSRANQRSVEALRGYCALVMLNLFSDEIFCQPTCIIPNCTFEIVNQFNDKKKYTIEENWQHDLTGNQVTPDHSYAINLLGKKVGQTFTDTSGIQTKVWTVSYIQSKYASWFNEATKILQDHFPTDKGFEIVNVRAPGENEYDFTPVFESVNQRSESARLLIDMYNSNPIPICILAAMFGHSTLDLWVGLRFSSEIFCCAGIESEREAAFNLIDTNSSYIIDPLTLYTLFEIGIQDNILATLKDIGITQSAVNVFTHRIIDLKSSHKSGQLAPDGNGRYVMIEHTQEQIDRNLELLNAIIKWIDDNCTIVTAIGNINDFGWNKIDFEFESWITDTLLAAGSSNRVLLSEDVRYRILAKQIHEIEGIWIQPALMISGEQGHLSLPEYNNAIARLIEMNHSLISFDVFNLLDMLEKNEWKHSGTFLTAVNTLSKPSIDIESALVLIAQSYTFIWNNNIPTKVATTTLLLDIVTKGRNDQSQFILKALTNTVKFLEHHLRSPFIKTLETWAIGHFLVKPGEFYDFLKSK